MTRTCADREQGRRPVRSGPVIPCVSEREILLISGQLPEVDPVSRDPPAPADQDRGHHLRREQTVSLTTPGVDDNRTASAAGSPPARGNRR